MHHHKTVCTEICCLRMRKVMNFQPVYPCCTLTDKLTCLILGNISALQQPEKVNRHRGARIARITVSESKQETCSAQVSGCANINYKIKKSVHSNDISDVVEFLKANGATAVEVLVDDNPNFQALFVQDSRLQEVFSVIILKLFWLMSRTNCWICTRLCT